MDTFAVGETVRVNTPGESHHDRTGEVQGTSYYHFGERVWVHLGDVTWQYRPDELTKEETE
jgi:hypothetical protein